MQIRVLREACCAQDDQMGPLEAYYEVGTDTRLDELIEQIVASRFLQYSTPLVTLRAIVDEQVLALVHSRHYYPDKTTEFLVAADSKALALLAGKTLDFRFIR